MGDRYIADEIWMIDLEDSAFAEVDGAHVNAALARKGNVRQRVKEKLRSSCRPPTDSTE